MPTLIRAVPLLLALLAMLSPQRALAARRVAVLVGANTGWRQDPPLSYAEDDARRIRTVLVELGEFEADAIVLLSQPTTEELRAELRAAKQRLSAGPGEETRFVFYYSGHADEQYLHLSGPQLTYNELYQSLLQIPATVKLGIFDTCRSGAILSSKGATPAESFRITVQNESDVRGTIILTSSSANELSQEAQALGGSFFTHYLVSGLRGAADEDGNRQLSLKEVYGYTSTRTRLATAITPSGPQSPSFINELKGRGDLTLTRLDGPVASLLFHPDERRCFVTDAKELRVIAEIIPHQQGGLRLAIPPGRHRLKCADGEKYLVAQLDLKEGDQLDVSRLAFDHETPAWGMTSIKASPLLRRIPREASRTGSRIARAEPPAAPFLSVIDEAQLQATGRPSLEDLFQNLPEQPNVSKLDGATRVNLRGLGSLRTLVLLNGRRQLAGGIGADASANLNSIPTAAIQRIEILKEGGAAVYGSGAIAGVVNIITRRNHSGTELRAFSGLSSRGDGLLYDLSLTTGLDSERGNIVFTAGYYSQKNVFAGNRPFSRYDTSYNYSSRQIRTEGSSSTPQGVFFEYGATTGNTAWDDLVARYPAAPGFTLDPRTGAFRPFNAAGVEDAGGDLYNYQTEHSLVAPQQRAQIFSTGGLRLGAGARAFYEASYSTLQLAQQLAPEALFTTVEDLTVSAANVYNPFGRDFVDVRRRLNELGGRHYARDLTSFHLVAGLEGKLPGVAGPLEGFTWDLAFSYGGTQGVETMQGLLHRSRLSSALGPSFKDAATGKARCGTPSEPLSDCVPLNLFGGQGTITPEMVDYVRYDGIARFLDRQQSSSISANLGGELFKLSEEASPVGFALGYEHRREGGTIIPDALLAQSDTAAASFYVNEAHAELAIPLLGTTNPETDEQHDILELSGAARVVRYNFLGTGFSYELGTRLSVIRDVMARATYSTALRAPSVAELYAGQLGQLSQDEGGNAGPQAETARLLTVGLALEPRFLKNVTATVEYFDISVEESIAPADPILRSCYPSGGNSSGFCGRLLPFLTGEGGSVDGPRFNVGGDKTAGLDLNLRYQPETPIGRVGLSLNATWLRKFDRILADGRLVQAKGRYDLGVYPSWKANLGMRWTRGPSRATANVRWINGFEECQSNSCAVKSEGDPKPLARRVKASYAFDANVAYDWETKVGTATMQLGVNNLLDAKPPYVANSVTVSADLTAYDVMGRYFYARLLYHYD